MSFLAEVMEAIRYTEAQNQMLLSRKIPLERLAKAWGKSVRRLERQRKLLIELESLENDRANPRKAAGSMS